MSRLHGNTPEDFAQQNAVNVAPRPEAPTLDEKIEGQRNIIARLDDAEGLRIANGILESLLELDKLKRMAATGTAENFLQCADETKRSLFAIGIIESSARKKAEERLRAIEQAAGMPEYPGVIIDKLETNGQHFDWPLIEQFEYDNLRAHCLHLSDKLARMEALLREPDEETLDSVRGVLQILRGQPGAGYGNVKFHYIERGDDPALWPAWADTMENSYVTECGAAKLLLNIMSAALLAKIAKEKE